jgi:endo-beta-N-acetylglucosaminidase D
MIRKKKIKIDITENIVGRGVKHYPSLLAIGCWKYLDSVVYWMLEVFGQCGILDVGSIWTVWYIGC